MSPSEKYLTAYEQNCVRQTGETLIRITLEVGRGRLTLEAISMKDALIAKIGMRMVCRLIRVRLEETRSRDLNQSILDVGELVKI